jgi:cation diffusion facilitator family transporter
MTNQTNELKGIKIALFGSIVLVILQIGGYLFTHVLILLAGGFDTLSDVFISSFLLASLIISQRPDDESHMFGHGRAQNVAAFITASILIFVLGIEMFREAIPAYLYGRPVELHSLEIAYTITTIALIVYLVPLVSLAREKKRGAAAKAQMVALLEMEVAFIASLIGLFFVQMGYVIADAAVSIFIAIILIITGVELFKENIDFLMGKAPPKSFFEMVKKETLSMDGIHGVYGIKAQYVGPDDIQLIMHITVDGKLTIAAADRITDELEAKICKNIKTRYCHIHVDPIEDNDRSK